jgi:NAD+ diphosphatase
LRQLFGLISDDLLTLAGRAIHLLYWDSTTQFCGRCGHTTLLKTDERAKECPQCGLINYPQLAPAVIILIEKDNEILLARSPRFKPKMYSVIAGFVEPGETLEQTVLREIREEVGIQVHKIQYFGSQHWPFPQSLMIAFTAEYLSGQITIDHREIEDADWFTIENLPPIPNKMSISRWLIDWFIEKHSKVK